MIELIMLTNGTELVASTENDGRCIFVENAMMIVNSEDHRYFAKWKPILVPWLRNVGRLAFDRHPISLSNVMIIFGESEIPETVLIEYNKALDRFKH